MSLPTVPAELAELIRQIGETILLGHSFLFISAHEDEDSMEVSYVNHPPCCSVCTMGRALELLLILTEEQEQLYPPIVVNAIRRARDTVADEGCEATGALN